MVSRLEGNPEGSLNRGSWRWLRAAGHSLLDLVAAVGASVTDDELQLLAGILHKLALEGPLLGLSGPGQTLVDIEEAIESKGQGDEPPAHCLPHLQRHNCQLRHPPSILSARPTGLSQEPQSRSLCAPTQNTSFNMSFNPTEAKRAGTGYGLK